MIEWLRHWLENDNTYVFYLLSCYFVIQCFDMILGVVIAKISPKIEFSSYKWKIGIIIKLIQFAVIVFMLPVFLIFGDLGLTVYFTMLIGLIGSELYSVMGHFNLVNDGKTSSIDIILEAIKKLFNKDVE